MSCALADATKDELAAFYVSNYRIRINQLATTLDEILPAMDRAEHLAMHSTILHELHHFYASVGTSFGYLLWVLRQAELIVASTCVAGVRQLGFAVHKPLVPWMERQGWGSKEYAGRREQLLMNAVATWRDLDQVLRALVGSASVSDEDLAALFEQAITGVCDYHARNRARADSYRAYPAMEPDANPAFASSHRHHMLSLKATAGAQLGELARRSEPGWLSASSRDVRPHKPDWRTLMEGAARSAQFLYQVYLAQSQHSCQEVQSRLGSRAAGWSRPRSGQAASSIGSRVLRSRLKTP